MMKALMIIDVQNDYFEGGKSELSNPIAALQNIQKALKKFRDAKLPIIFIKHISNYEGATFFLPDTSGVLIHKNITPLDDEHIVIKHRPSSFLNTDLSEILKNNNIGELFICGMMSHMCVDTTVRACMDFSLKVTLLEDACATKNLSWRGETIPADIVHKTFMASLDKTFANVIKTNEFEIE